MLATTSYRNSIKQLKEIETQRVEQTLSSSLIWFQTTPFVVGFLRLTENVVNVCAYLQTLIHDFRFAFVSQLQLVFQVVETIIDRRSR